jgi:hypothetical protein
MPPVTTGSFANHLAPGIREIVGTSLEGREAFYSLYHNVQTTKRNYEDVLAATGLPIAVEKAQGTNIQSFDPLEGVTRRLTPKVYAIGMEVTEEASEDDLYSNAGSAIRAGANGIADSLAERTELEGHRPFTTEGFSATNFYVLPDLTAFIATAHAPIIGGAGPSQANRPATDADLSVTSFRAALTQFRKYKNDQGIRVPMVTIPDTMFVAPDTEWDAKEILRSSDRPDTMNRVENVTKGIVNLVVDPYLSDDPDAWYLKAKKHYSYFLWRKRPVMDAFDDKRARVAVHVGLMRFSCAPVHWLGWYGTSGV